jgi:hypothetical protein
MGLGMLLGSVVFYYDLSDREQRSRETGRSVHLDPAAARMLYDAGGKPLVVGTVAVVGLAAWGVGFVQLARRRNAADAPVVAQADLTAMLLPALGFTAEDLDANRQGVLTERQRAQVDTLHRQGGIAVLVAGVIIVLTFAAIGSYVLFLAPTGEALRRGPMGPMIPLVLGGAVLLVLASLAGSVRRQRSLRAGRVSAVEGKAKLRSRQVSGAMAAVAEATGADLRASTIKVAGTKFHVDEATVQAFKEGALYRIYYVKNAPIHLILSAEALGNG